MKYLLVDPVFWLLLATIIFILNNTFLKYKSIRNACYLVYLFVLCLSLPIVSNSLVKYQEYTNDNSGASCFNDGNNVLVILSGGINNNEHQFMLSKLQLASYTRVLSAYQIYQNNRSSISKIVIAGGVGHDVKEADVVKKLLTSLGVESGRLYIDRESTNTYQNAKNVAAILSASGVDVSHSEIVLVTSALHMKRALFAFESVGLSICAYPVASVYVSNLSFLPRLSALNKSTGVIQEVISYWFYFLMHKK